MSQAHKQHSWRVRWRAFKIWQELGYYPWKKTKSLQKKRSGDFYKGAFDAIPFLNDDAKRTFVHLLLRPGYMIRDYIRGKHDIYLAPLTSLIVFYAFFALVSSVLQPIKEAPEKPLNINMHQFDEAIPDTRGAQLTQNTVRLVQQGWILLHLDQYPDEVDTQHEASLAALEGALRSQGIPLFIGDFFFLWLAMGVALRRYRMGASAHAAASAYVLCQFSFFMLFAVLISWGKTTSLDAFLMFILLIVDYRQWLGVDWKKSIRLSISTGIMYLIMYGAILLSISALTVLVALFMK